MKTASTKKQAGVALVTTIIVIAVLAVVAVAFMQSTTSDRFSSRSVVNYTRAKLAADAGLAVASAILVSNTTNDTFIVVANTNGQLFVGNGIRGSTNFSYAPLFSAASSLTNPVAPVVTSSNPSVALPGGFQTNLILPGGLSATSPNIAWTYLTDTNGAITARFAFWVEDLGGRLDLSVVGTDNEDVAKRPTGTNPAEIALWSLFPSIADSSGGDAAAQADQIVRARDSGALLTAATSRLLQNSAVTADMLADLAVGLGHDTNEPEIIPFGLGYDADEGKPKYNLNLVSSGPGAVATLADIIDDNLSDGAEPFGSRGGGLAGPDYVNNLAANIVDFIDSDATPTVGNGYRGVENIPFLNERLTRFVLSGAPVDAGGGSWEIRFFTTEYLEFWNLHNRTSPSTVVTFSYTNRQPLNYSGLTNFNIVTNHTVSVPAMPPGSYFVTNLPTITNVFSVTAFASPSTNPICTLIGNSRTVEYSLAVNGQVYDRGSGSHYSDKLFRPGDPDYFSASYPGLGSKVNIAGTGDSDFLNSVGDPRATFYMVDGGGQARPQIQQSWINGNTSFGGRTLQGGMETMRLTKEVRMENWGDGGHSGSAGPGPSGTTPPAVGLFVTNEANFAPAAANPNTNGRIDRITDLAAIFDPMQWGEANQSTRWPKEAGAWTNLTKAAAANTAYGGGHTLRVGRSEFTRFTNTGLRSAQLLDLLAVSAVTNSSSGGLINTVRGKININTATANSLRALGAGFFHAADPLVASGSGDGTNFVVPSSAVDGFVAGVTSFRSLRPFYSVSQLAMIATNNDAAQWPTNAVFGNRKLLGITAGNDAVTEEWFGRIYPMATTRSRNFLIHVIGQVFPTNSLVPVSSYAGLFQIYLEPQRNSGGLTTNSIARLLYAWPL